MIRAVALVAVVLSAATAHADSPKLAEARTAIDAVQYDVAARLLAEALEEGGNSPAALIEIHQRAASTAVVLRDEELATKHFRAWLALDPKASPPTATAEKFRAPFIAAQAYVKQHGALSVRIAKRDNTAIEVIIESDPLGLVASASLDGTEPAARVPAGAERRIALPVPAGQGSVHVYVFDQYGNRLVERAFATFFTLPSDYRLVRRTPFFRQWQVWGVATVAIAAGGFYAGRQAHDAQDELDRIAASPDTFFYSDFTRARDRRDRDALIANGLFVGAGLCAVTAVVMFAMQPPKTWVLVPKVEGARGLAVVGRF